MRWLVVACVVVVACAGTAWAVHANRQHHPRKPQTVTLGPGAYVLKLGDRVEEGDMVKCVTVGGGPAGGGPVMPPGQGVNSSMGFSELTRGGAAHVSCPAHPSDM
jgi:hypothetical protein